MPLRIEPNAEPISGYRLIERLGGGGFGEVWKAEAPGGLFKAIKFVYGEISIDESITFDDPDGSRAKQELRSLNRVKTVHHPYILSLERFEIIQGQLVIVMELADKTLWDRFKECRAQGLTGIPRIELLDYMRETAEALDLMNTQFQLQHLDIKPQNIFLVFNHVKVADFGLVKDLANQQNATITGGVTPVYAAPETFDGWLSRQSDQYSLAIVFQELLTGQRPFAGSSMKQLILHHLQSAPDLTLLPVADRPIVGRALAKNPDERYPSCLEFIQLLQKATSAGGDAKEAKGSSSPSAATKQPVDTPNWNDNLGARSHGSGHSELDIATDATHTAGARGNSGPVKPSDPNFSTEEAFNGQRPQILPRRPEKDQFKAPLTPDGEGHKTLRPATARGGKDQGRPPTQELPGILQPTLIVGLGKLGVETLQHFRRRICSEFGSGDALAQVRVLGIDTDPETLQQMTHDTSKAALQLNEVVLARLQRPAHYLKTRDGKLPTDTWLNPKLLYRLPREQTSAALRALGRLAFVDNFRSIAKRLEGELQACGTQDTLHGDTPTQGLGLRTSVPRVYIVTSLMGNTGGGMFLDVAYLIRKLIRAQGHEDAEIVGVFYVPTVRRDAALASGLMNTFASLVELQHFSRPESLFSARYEIAGSSNKDYVSETGFAFQRCVMLSLPEVKGKVSARDNVPVLSLAGDFLCRDVTTLLGPAIDEQRRQKLNLSNDWRPGEGPLLQSLGMFRIRWPRRIVLELCARRMSTQLVARWMNKDAKGMADTIRTWTQERWETLGMRPENLIERFQKLTENRLQQTPEQTLAEVLTPLHQALCGAGPAAKGVSLGPVLQAMGRLETTVGSPEENRTATSANVEPSLLERTLTDIALVIADECEQKLAELAVTLLEDPNYRLAGAEEALRQFCTTVEQSLQSQETLAKELTEKSSQLHQRIVELVETPLPAGASFSDALKLNPRRSLGGKNAPTAKDMFDLVRSYAKARYHSLVLIFLNRLYVGLRGHLSDQIREVGFCRQRLGELQGLLQPAPTSRDKKAETTPGERVLFPAGCMELNDAVERICQGIVLEDLLSFDAIVQRWIETHCQALLEVCMGSATMVKNLAPAMIEEAENFLGTRLEGASVAEMYLARKRIEAEAGSEDSLRDDLESCHEEAAPEIGRLSESNEVSLICLPNDPHGQEVLHLLQKYHPDQKILMTDRRDEMVFYREVMNIPWKDLDQLGPIAQEAYAARNASDPSSLHSREDIAEWQSLATFKRP